MASAACQLELLRIGEVTAITASTALPNIAWYCWYVDGGWVGSTRMAAKSFQFAVGQQAQIDCLATDEEDFDAVANAPDGYPSTRTIWWARSVATGVACYAIQQQENGGDWATIATVAQTPDDWDFAIETDRLDDLSSYAWQVVPIDAAGNQGTPLAIAAEQIVRVPDAPNFAVEFNPTNQTIAFAEAAA